jgi:hypothetical protein
MSLLAKKTRDLSPQDLEFIKEAASALARCGERLEKALGKLGSAEEHLDRCMKNRTCVRPRRERGPTSNNPRKQNPSPDTHLEQAIRQYQKAWRQAEKARYVYIVQREAIGFRNHKFADRIYPLPPLRDPPS